MSEIIDFNAENSNVSEERLQEMNTELQPEIERMRDTLEETYDNPRSFINLPEDDEMIESVKELAEEKKELNPEYIVVAGIGGSNLGTIAVQQAILGTLYNQKTRGTKILFAETTDSDHVHDIIDIIEPVLENGGNVLLNGVSKSGGTTETIANFEVIEEKMEKYKENPEKFITVTSVRDSPFYRMAEDKNYSTLEIPEKIGGRYSVFSPVGLFPLGVLGLDLDELLRGTRRAKERCLKNEISENPAARSAATIYENKNRENDIHDLFLYGKDLEMTGKWYRQLLAESLGKKHDTDGEVVNEGVTPLVSVGSTDLHSMMQLYMEGPEDKFHSFIWVEENKEKLHLPEKEEYEELVENIQGMEMKSIMDSIYQGVNSAFEKENLPYSLITLPDKSEKSIGALLQFKMMEVVYLGHLMNVDPFTQPGVEAYKTETKKLLKNV